MTYRLVLTVEKEQSVLVLFEGGVERARRDWEESRDMGRRAFESIEEVLHEAGIGPQEVLSFQVISELPDASTSTAYCGNGGFGVYFRSSKIALENKLQNRKQHEKK
jgi:hypothetical protein